MKKLLTTLLLIMMHVLNAIAQSTASIPDHRSLDDKKAARFYFIDGETHDFGTIGAGPDIVHVFKFKNIGKEPLIITHAGTSGGGDVAEWSRAPVLPGKTGEIKVTLHTAGRASAPFHKTTWITSNAASDKSRYEIYIKGNIAEKVNAPSSPDHPSTNDKDAPRFHFINGETHDFGTVKEGPDAVYVFRFKNIGKSALIITRVSPSGGSLPEWTREPVAPGKTGEIRIAYHTAGRAGQPFNKSLYILSNAVDNISLSYRGYVDENPITNSDTLKAKK